MYIVHVLQSFRHKDDEEDELKKVFARFLAEEINDTDIIYDEEKNKTQINITTILISIFFFYILYGVSEQ